MIWIWISCQWIWISRPWLWISDSWIWMADVSIHMKMSCMNYFTFGRFMFSPSPHAYLHKQKPGHFTLSPPSRSSGQITCYSFLQFFNLYLFAPTRMIFEKPLSPMDQEIWHTPSKYKVSILVLQFYRMPKKCPVRVIFQIFGLFCSMNQEWIWTIHCLVKSLLIINWKIKQRHFSFMLLIAPVGNLRNEKKKIPRVRFSAGGGGRGSVVDAKKRVKLSWSSNFSAWASMHLQSVL